MASAIAAILAVTPPVEERFTLIVRDVELHFRRPLKYGDLKAFWTEAEQFAAMLFEEGTAMPLEWTEFLPTGSPAQRRREAIDAFTLHYWSVDPTRVTQLDALQFFAIARPIDVHKLTRDLAAEILAAPADAEFAAVEAVKKALEATAGKGSGSPSPAMPSGNTPKRSRRTKSVT
jgi:hypothetical protein